jgi:hypothetical protein
MGTPLIIMEKPSVALIPTVLQLFWELQIFFEENANAIDLFSAAVTLERIF